MASKRNSAPRFASQERVVLPGSEKAPFASGERGLAIPAKGQMAVSMVVRRKQPLAVGASGPNRITRAEYRRLHAADAKTIKLVHQFAAEFGLAIEKDTPKPERRTVYLRGSVPAMERAFGVKLSQQAAEGGSYRVRAGSITLPAELAPEIVAVLGLDDRPQAKAHFRVRGEAATPAAGITQPRAATPSSLTPVQVAQLYQFPAGASAAGQTIGLIELGGGFRTADINAYFKSLNQKPPTVVAVSVDKGKNSPSTASGADGEVMLDIEVAAAVAPGAKIAVYFAPNTDQGFIDAIATAVHDTVNKPSVISISWGAAESNWTVQSMNALDAACQSAAALGITVTAAAGDDASTDGVADGENHVDFPASSPHVLACGGTQLIGTGSTISSEIVWNELGNKEGATGGGVSAVFSKPGWQSSAKVPAPTGGAGGRGVPDVAGNADPTTGYVVRVDGQTLAIGGTSAVAPLWAGLIAVANKQNGKSAGFLHPQIYASKAKGGFRDITQGNNPAFLAGPGWDACTGLGSPIAQKLIPFLKPGGTTSTRAVGGSKKVTAKRATRVKPVKR